MGKMKELSLEFKGYTVEATVYYHNNNHPEFYSDFIELGHMTADTVKSIINKRNCKRIPENVYLYIYNTYGKYKDYHQYLSKFELTSKQIKEAWV